VFLVIQTDGLIPAVQKLDKGTGKAMDTLKQVKEILAQQNPQEKYYQLDQLCDVLEYHHGLNEADVIEGIQPLLPVALQEDNKEVREAFFYQRSVRLRLIPLGQAQDRRCSLCALRHRFARSLYTQIGIINTHVVIACDGVIHA
jgi:hypothetical protein